MTDHIAEALDRLVPEFESVDADWQGILTASAPAAVGPARGQRTPAPRRVWARVRSARRGVRVAIALAVLAIVTTGAAWAAGVFSPSPQELFSSSFPATDSGAGTIFQNVIAGSVKRIASVDIPKVGTVDLWHGDTAEGGFCLGLRLSDGSWLGTRRQAGGSPLDGGGAVPGCFPTGVIDGGNHHLEWLENDIDARSVGGAEWRIRTGVVTVPGAVKVTDLATGQSTNVVDGNVFLLAIQAPNPALPQNHSPHLHLVAYDKDGNIVANDCLWNSCTAMARLRAAEAAGDKREVRRLRAVVERARHR